MPDRAKNILVTSCRLGRHASAKLVFVNSNKNLLLDNGESFSAWGGVREVLGHRQHPHRLSPPVLFFIRAFSEKTFLNALGKQL